MAYFNYVCGLLLPLNVAIAQNTSVGSTFEAALIRAVERGPTSDFLRGGPGTNSPERLTGTATLKQLLMRAYDLRPYQIVGPGWLDSARYEIQAKLPAGADQSQLAMMLRLLLIERFGLKEHRETRQLAAYELTIARGGPKLTSTTTSTTRTDNGQTPAIAKFVKGADGLPELTPGTDVPRTYTVVLSGPDGLLSKVLGRRETMPQLADRLSAQLSRPVIDATGLKGEYDFTLTWATEHAGGMVPRTEPPPDEIETASAPVLSGISLLGALQTQLGLQLKAKRRPVGVLVIERVNVKPTEN